jgi:hypothetical protein
LRHFSLYEFAYKPRVELIMNTKESMVTTFNAPLESLQTMELVGEEEAAKMAGFLGASRSKVDAADQMEALRTESHVSARSQPKTDTVSAHESSVERLASGADKSEEVDWSRVGRVYDKGTDINDVVQKEIARINKAWEIKLAD